MAVAGFRHLGLKVVSIALAALLWLVVSGEQTVERVIRIPLEFTNLPSNLELVGQPPEVVEVRVRGSSGTLSRIAAGELVAVLDVKSAKPGQRLFHLSAADVRSPFGVAVVQVTPSNLSVGFELSASKVVPIVPGVEGAPAVGFEVGAVTASPPTVEVLGPESALETLTEAITEPVSVAGASAPVSESVTVGVPDPAVRLKSPLLARVTVDVAAAAAEWSVGGVRVQIRNAARPAQLAPELVTVYLRGPRGAAAPQPADFDASVDLQGFGPGQFVLPVRIAAPGQIKVARVDPVEVRVRIR